MSEVVVVVVVVVVLSKTFLETFCNGKLYIVPYLEYNTIKMFLSDSVRKYIYFWDIVKYVKLLNF